MSSIRHEQSKYPWYLDDDDDDDWSVSPYHTSVPYFTIPIVLPWDMPMHFIIMNIICWLQLIGAGNTALVFLRYTIRVVTSLGSIF